MTKPSDSDHARLPLGMRSAFEGVARWPWMASEMGTDDARTTPTHQSHHSAQRVVEKAGRSITNSETPHLYPGLNPANSARPQISTGEGGSVSHRR